MKFLIMQYCPSSLPLLVTFTQILSLPLPSHTLAIYIFILRWNIMFYNRTTQEVKYGSVYKQGTSKAFTYTSPSIHRIKF
jgi:hypothetical protein